MADSRDVYRAIISYSDRTELVRQAITDLRPLTFSDFDMQTAPVEEAVAFYKQLVSSPQVGEWKDAEGHEWKYFFHGGGCCLTHPVTGEEIDWNPAQRYVVDKFFFIRWLISLERMSGEPSEARKQKIENGISAAFDQLVSEGRLMCLNEVSHNIYKLMDLEYYL